MFITLQENIQDIRPAKDELSELLAGLGFDTERLDVQMDLAIDSFDQWTNPRDAALVPSSTNWTGADALERVA